MASADCAHRTHVFKLLYRQNSDESPAMLTTQIFVFIVFHFSARRLYYKEEDFDVKNKMNCILRPKSLKLVKRDPDITTVEVTIPTANY